MHVYTKTKLGSAFRACPAFQMKYLAVSSLANLNFGGMKFLSMHTFHQT